MTNTSPSDEADRISRLERRLARERTARLAAEAIAEQGMRDLYEQKQRLELVETIATAANLSDGPESAFRFALEAICEYTGWTIGHVWMFEDGEPDTVLVSSGVWRMGEGPACDRFREASAAMTVTLGVGLPGRVWESRRACWIEDVTRDDKFARAAAADACGLKAAFAFPALIGEEVGAVLEFFQYRPATPDDELLRTLDQVGAQLGRVLERYRNARRVAANHATLEALYAEAEDQRAAAEQASRAKSAFLAVTSHEIRTPLNAVLGLSEALKREPLTPHQRELNDGVLSSGQMLLRLLNAVLDMSRIEADQATLRVADFDMSEKLRAIISIWTPRAAELGVSLTLDDHGFARPRMRGDEGRIEQTLVNLVSNALKFTPRGGEVRLVVRRAGAGVRLEVIDGGPGVDDADRERIFLPYEQTEAGRQAGGAGLGLSICTGNVRLLGGRIHADRTASGASRFWFECPVEDAEAPTDLEADDGAAVQGGLRVLAAEDNAGNRRVLEVLLEPLGVALTLVENGLEAVEAMSRQGFDLVLMDANMPVMDGAEAVRRIRAGDLARTAPVYMLTANAFAEDVARYLAAGADGVLTKPVQVPQLYAILGECIGQPSGRRRDAA